MADISTVTMLNGTVYNLKDAALRNMINETQSIFLDNIDAQNYSKAGDILFELSIGSDDEEE